MVGFLILIMCFAVDGPSDLGKQRKSYSLYMLSLVDAQCNVIRIYIIGSSKPSYSGTMFKNMFSWFCLFVYFFFVSFVVTLYVKCASEIGMGTLASCSLPRYTRYIPLTHMHRHQSPHAPCHSLTCLSSLP